MGENHINKLTVEVKIHKLTWDEELGENREFVEYYIDGISLRKILGLENDGRDFDEDYIGLPPSDFFYPATHFIGEAQKALEEENGTRIILICSACGEVICHDVVYEIEVTDESVIWKNFMTPAYEDTFNNLKGGPFMFDREDYEEVLKNK